MSWRTESNKKRHKVNLGKIKRMTNRDEVSAITACNILIGKEIMYVYLSQKMKIGKEN